MIYRPALLIQCSDRSNTFYATPYNYNVVKQMRFWIIPYSTIDVNGYDIDEVDEPELILMERTFQEINHASLEYMSEEDDSSETSSN